MAEPVAVLSPLDEARFGVRTARAVPVTTDVLPQVMDFCRAERIQFLIARCPTQDSAAVHAMERLAFRLMETLVYFRRDLTRQPLPERSSVPIRPAGPADLEAVRRIAQEAFRGYNSHYRADTRLDPAACDDLYVDWAGRCCTQKEMADEVLVAEQDGEPVGFLALKLLGDGEADGRLYAVSPHAQGRGVGQALLAGGLHWCKAQELPGMVISTQVTNLASQASWVRVGFVPYQSFYTFHKWFDEVSSS